MGSYFYEDEDKKILRKELLEEKAKVWAKGFISPKEEKKEIFQHGKREIIKLKDPSLKSTQLRKYHIEAKAIQERMRNLEDANDFDRILPLVKMMKAKVAYACPPNRKDRKIPLEFRKYIELMVDNITDPKDYEAFSLCFESVVGYFYGEGGRSE